MIIKTVKISKLKPAEYNPRKMDEVELKKLERSLSKYGMVEPVVINKDNTVIGGHQRLVAAKNIGLVEVPCFQVKLDKNDERLLNLALNRIHGEWDFEKLDALVKQLKEDGADLQQSGFDDVEFAQLEARMADDVEQDEVPDAENVKAVCKAGDIWILGTHRLMCGDSTNKNAVTALLNGAKPSLMITDPPYGIDYDPDWRNDAAKKGFIAHAAIRVGVVTNDHICDWSLAWELSPSKAAYVWHAGIKASIVQGSLEKAGYEIRAQIIWAKLRFAISRGHYHWQHEPCWYAIKKSENADWIGDRCQTTLWEVNLDENVAGGHSTQKPVECMARPMRNHSGDVYEPFSGSGTTIIAAEQLNRRCFAMELEPRYCDIAIARWEKLTGGKAKRQ